MLIIHFCPSQGQLKWTEVVCWCQLPQEILLIGLRYIVPGDYYHSSGAECLLTSGASWEVRTGTVAILFRTGSARPLASKREVLARIRGTALLSLRLSLTKLCGHQEAKGWSSAEGCLLMQKSGGSGRAGRAEEIGTKMGKAGE